MGEEKRNKIVAAITVNAILLIFIILAVLIAQIVQISVLKRRKEKLLAQLEEYASIYSTTEDFWLSLESHGEMYDTVMQLHNEFNMSYDEIMDYLQRHGIIVEETTAVAGYVLAIIVE